MKAILNFFPLLLLLSSCSLFDADEPVLSLRTNRMEYDVTSNGTIEVEARNISSSIIFYNRCMPTKLIELEGNQTRNHLWFPVCFCRCLAELNPGESWTFNVSMIWIEQNMDKLNLKANRSYHLQMLFFSDDRMKNRLDVKSLFTNRFSLSE